MTLFSPPSQYLPKQRLRGCPGQISILSWLHLHHLPRTYLSRPHRCPEQISILPPPPPVLGGITTGVKFIYVRSIMPTVLYFITNFFLFITRALLKSQVAFQVGQGMIRDSFGKTSWNLCVILPYLPWHSYLPILIARPTFPLGLLWGAVSLTLISISLVPLKLMSLSRNTDD